MAKSAKRRGQLIASAILRGAWVVCGFVMLAASESSAEPWQISGQVSENLIFDSNIRLSRDNPKAVFGSITSLAGSASYLGPRFDTRVSADASIARYIGESGLNSEQFGVSFQSFYRTPRSIYGLSMSARRASTLTTELADSGNLSQVANQYSFSVDPTWQYELSPLDSITLSGGAAYRTFDSSSFADQATFSFRSSYQRRLSASSAVSLSASATYLESKGSRENSRTQSFALLAGWSKSISDRLSFNISAGPRLSFTHSSRGAQVSDEDPTIGADVDLVLSYRFSERTLLSLNAGQSLEPSSVGTVQERQRVGLLVSHRLSQKAQLTFSGTVQRNGAGLAGGGRNTDGQRLFFATSTNVSYQISQTLSASAGHTFRSQSLDDSRSRAFSHGFAIVLTYSPGAWLVRD